MVSQQSIKNILVDLCLNILPIFLMLKSTRKRISRFVCVAEIVSNHVTDQLNVCQKVLKSKVLISTSENLPIIVEDLNNSITRLLGILPAEAIEMERII